MTTPRTYQETKTRLQAHFHFSRMPFTKHMWAKQMFDSESQGELRSGLTFWTELRGICLVCGPNGAGKSISLRRFTNDLDGKRHEVLYTCPHGSSQLGFFRSLSRTLGLPVRAFLSDMFDAASQHLGDFEQKTGKHPVLIIDDADILDDSLLEMLRRLANFEMDREDRFSLILSGMQSFATRLKLPQNKAIHQRITFAHNLRGFSLQDTQNYIAFHLERADGPKNLFSEDAVRLLFQVSKGLPRVINQLALQSLIQAAVRKKDAIDADFIKYHVLSNPLFDPDEPEIDDGQPQAKGDSR